MISSTDLKDDGYLRMLLMGPAKLGKTAAAIATSPGPVAVMLCEDQSALRYARRITTKPFDVGLITAKDPWESMQKEIDTCRRGAKEGRYKTIIVDPFSNFAAAIEKILREQTKDNAMVWSNQLWLRLDDVIEGLFRIPAHVIAITHHMDVSGELDNQLAKTGNGIVPLIAGKSRALIAAKFHDIVWMDFFPRKRDQPADPWHAEPYNGRAFVTGPQGAWGPGCRSSDGAKILPADIGLLIEEFGKAARETKPTRKK